MSDAPNTEKNTEKQAATRRLRGFAIHLALYFLTMIVLVVVNFTTRPENLWFVLPMIGWGSILALHTAYVMGLFGGLMSGPAGKPD